MKLALIMVPSTSRSNRTNVPRAKRVFGAAVCVIALVSIATAVSAKPRKPLRQRPGVAQPTARPSAPTRKKGRKQIAADTDWDLALLPDPTGGLLAIRRGLLEAAEARLRDVRTEDLEQPGVRIARIRVRQRLADLAYWHITLSVAEHWLELARQDINAGLRGTQEREQLAMLDALYWSKQGKVAFARGQMADAAGDFEKSLDTLSQLRAAQNGRSSLNQDDLLLSVATSKLELGLALIQHAAQPAKEQAGVRLLDDAVALFGQAGSTPYHQGLAADAKLHLSEQALGTQQLSEAAILLTSASEQIEVLHREAPTHMGWRASLIRTRWLRGRLLAAQGKPGPAIAALTEAVDRGRKLLADQPSEGRHKGQLLMVATTMVELSGHFERIQNPNGGALREELCRLIASAAAADPEYARIISIRNYACFGGPAPVR
jgi:tetratricopeptide (TPR) repeat protein